MRKKLHKNSWNILFFHVVKAASIVLKEILTVFTGTLGGCGGPRRVLRSVLAVLTVVAVSTAQ